MSWQPTCREEFAPCRNNAAEKAGAHKADRRVGLVVKYTKERASSVPGRRRGGRKRGGEGGADGGKVALGEQLPGLESWKISPGLVMRWHF